MTDIPALIKKNQERWDRMVLDAKRTLSFDSAAKRLTALENKPRFQAVTTRLQTAGYQPVPWFVIAVIAEREYGGPPRWDKQLGQGDPLNQVSRHDPAGRGPFLDHPGDNNLNNAWLRCALDALIDCAPHAALWHGRRVARSRYWRSTMDWVMLCVVFPVLMFGVVVISMFLASMWLIMFTALAQWMCRKDVPPS